MRPVTVSCFVDAPRERVFDYLADIANHARFSDNFTDQCRLTRMESRGVGAGVRFRLRSGPAVPFVAPFAGQWVELVLTELESPHHVLTEGSTGRIGRIPIRGEYQLGAHDHGMTRVSFIFSSEPAHPSDRLREALGGRSWVRRKLGRSLRRLRAILEEGDAAPIATRVPTG